MRALLLRQVRNYYPKNPSNRVLCLSSDETYEYVKRFVDAEQAVMIAKRLTESVGARIGTTRRIIITDGGHQSSHARIVAARPDGSACIHC